MAGVPFIHDEAHTHDLKTPYWAQWFREQGVENPNLSGGLRFDSADPAINAAVQGAGLLLASNVLAYDDLRTGRLVAPVAHSVAAGHGFYLVYPRASAEREPVRAFADWIIAEFEGLDGATLAGRVA